MSASLVQAEPSQSAALLLRMAEHALTCIRPDAESTSLVGAVREYARGLESRGYKSHAWHIRTQLVIRGHRP